MNVVLAGTIFAIVLSAGILMLLEIGRRIGVRQIREEGESASKGLGAIEGGVVENFAIASVKDLSGRHHSVLSLGSQHFVVGWSLHEHPGATERFVLPRWSAA